MYTLRRRILSQNFLHNRKLVEQLVRKSSIGQKDTVLEIGPGKGVITEQLLKKARNVIAVELDFPLYVRLTEKFAGSKIQLVHGDFLSYPLPSFPYKVFANIPFSIEGKIIRKLLASHNSPEDAYLVMREDLALRLGGFKKECQFSISYKPWFKFEIVHKFRRTDFSPYARMDTVLLRFQKIDTPLLPESERQRYMQFVVKGFGNGESIKKNLGSYLTFEQLQRLSIKSNFSIKDKPSYLSLEQWVTIYRFVNPKLSL